MLKHLIATARLGPTQRTALQRALVSRDRGRMAVAGRQVVETLVRKGELVRVAMQGAVDTDRRLYALRNHAGLLDLTALTDPPAPAVEADEAVLEPEAVAHAHDPAHDPLDVRDRLLRAMEQVQSLQTDVPENGDVTAWLDPVLTMLRASLPGVELFVELTVPSDSENDSQLLFHCEEAERPFWALNRVVGETARIPGFDELPRPLQERFGIAGPTASVDGGVAVPLYGPEREHAEDGTEGMVPEVGLLYVLPTRPYDVGELTRLAARLSGFVTHSWRQRLIMNRLVHTDRLTGLHNRGFFDSQLPLEVERCRRRGSPLVLLIGDIDHFKDVNDTYGHPMGDQVLKTVAREMQGGLRRIDVVCRIGGEEFALILPDTDVEAARDVITRLQVRIANLRLTDARHAEPIRVTVSFGGVAFPEGGADPEALYGLADDMLYLSKERGRNRCHFWRPDGDPLLALPQYKTD